MDVAIIRSALVYGPGIKTDFLSMMNWLHCGVPHPLGRVTKIAAVLSVLIISLAYLLLALTTLIQFIMLF